jgi:hypothetical protein
MTSIYHRRFYPGDVDGTVAYVAPQSFGIADPRYVGFVDNVGEASCRQQLADLQRLALTRRESMVGALKALEAAGGGSFSILGHDLALEHVVVDLPFTFWQYSGASTCSSIPDEKSSDSAIFWFLQAVGFLEWYQDKEIEDYQGYHYQSGTQLGTPQTKESHLQDLLKHPGTILPSTYCQVCNDAPFDRHAMVDIDAWVRSQGERLMFVYGADDPWTAGAFQLGDATDSYRYFVKDGTHSASISDLPEEERNVAIATLARWAKTQQQPGAAGQLGWEDGSGKGSLLGSRLQVGALRLQQKQPLLTGLRRSRL